MTQFHLNDSGVGGLCILKRSENDDQQHENKNLFHFPLLSVERLQPTMIIHPTGRWCRPGLRAI
jgi:hypothetical protein